MLKDTLFPTKITLNCQGKCIDLSQPVIMGILNLTPDSFFAGSRQWQIAPEVLLEKAAKMLEQGALFLDLGAYSTRPGAADISVEEEIDRLLPALENLRKQLPQALLSVDTFRSKVAEQALLAGAHLINDVSGGTLDAAMFATVAHYKVPYVLMHMRGTPQTMQQHTQYNQLVPEVISELLNKARELHQLGVTDVILDPGFGFAKTIDQNFEMLRQLDQLVQYGYPVLAGLSRKSMVYRTLKGTAETALNGTTVLNTIALSKGARILRVHDVQPAAEAIQLWKKIENI
ncbi:MAG: dihydropteroate synthase [Sphingobacteriaceae bacterium]|nr:dihydropteroate synthase [Sphingobacteriaceae bacterium]